MPILFILTVVAQQWVAKVRTEPNEPTMDQYQQQQQHQQRKSPILMKCEIDLIGGGRDFIEVLGWKWDTHLMTVKSHSIAGKSVLRSGITNKQANKTSFTHCHNVIHCARAP